MLQSLKSVLHLNHGEVEKNSETNVSLIKDTEVPSLEASNEESKPQLIRQNSRNILRIDPHWAHLLVGVLACLPAGPEALIRQISRELDEEGIKFEVNLGTVCRSNIDTKFNLQADEKNLELIVGSP